MVLSTAKPDLGFGLGCPAAEQPGRKRSRKAQGYVPEPIHEKLRAYCWYSQTSQSEFVAALVTSHVQRLEATGRLTFKMLELYRSNRRPTPGSPAGERAIVTPTTQEH